MNLWSRNTFRMVAAMAATAAVGSTAFAQSAQIYSEVSNTIVVSDPAVNGWSNARYTADRTAGSNYSGVVNLWFRNAQNQVISGCTGSLLGNGKILTAAHCVSNGAALTSTSFTARFFQTGVGWVDVNGSGYAVKTGYDGAVVNENDVAVLTLGGLAPVWARTYTLASGNVLGATQTFAGYGRVGTGNTGDNTSSNQFSDAALLRRGLNVFETTCRTGFTCATIGNASPSTFGGILLSDHDQSGISSAGTLCNQLGFCTAGFANFEEVTTGRGDSGGASFMNDFTITGVASFGQSSQGNLGFYGFAEGHTCVANIANNAGCQSNYDFVNRQVGVLVPEPATFVLLAAGLFGLVAVQRRRRA